MSRPRNVFWKWYPAEYLTAVNMLELSVQGGWMRIICHCQLNREKPGVMAANLAWVSADMRVSIEDAWRVLMVLAMLRIGDMRVNRGEGFEDVTEEWAQVHGTEKPAAFWKVEVTCRRVVRDLEQREAQIARNGGVVEKEAFPDTMARRTGDSASEVQSESVVSLARVRTRTRTRTRTRSGSRGKDTSRVEENTELMVRIGGWFRRAATTKWLTTEAAKLDRLAPPEDELAVLEAYYASTHPEIAPYRRRSVETLLNNWTGDLDRARSKLGQFGGDEGAGAEGTKGSGIHGPDMAIV